MLRRIPKLKKTQSVIVRIDANSDYRLRAVVPALRALRKQVSRVVLLSHFGDPGGRRVVRESLAPIAKRLSELLLEEVTFVRTIDSATAKKVREQKGFVLLENTRFYPGEEKNDPTFARLLSEYADVYVNEAFSVCHRKHASVAQITEYMPSFAGETLRAEIDMLGRSFESPIALIVGGIKLATKLPLLQAFASRADLLLIGSGTALPFFHARGIPVRIPGGVRGGSKEEALALKIAKTYEGRLLLPEDVRIEGWLWSKNRLVRDLKASDGAVYDIGTKTTALFADALRSAKTIIWNGPVGRSTERIGAGGTIRLAKAIGSLSAYSIVGGGDTLDELENRGLLSNFSAVSTGGGTMLAYLSGEDLPGIRALES